MSDREVNIDFNTRANTSGAKDTEKALKKVNEEGEKAASRPPPRIIDSNAAKDTETLREQTEAFTEWQKARDAARETSSSSLATNVPDFLKDSAKVDAFNASMAKMQEAAKAGAEALPPLSEADVIAESLKNLGDKAGEAAGKSKLGGFRDGLRGVINGASASGVGGGAGGLLAMGRALIGVLNPVGLVTAAVTVAAVGWNKWRVSLNEFDEQNRQSQREMDALARQAGFAADAEKVAEENARLLAAAQGEVALRTHESSGRIGEFNRRLEESIRLEKELRDLRDKIANEQAEVALDAADGDPVAQQAIREAARKAKQAQELADIDADMARQKKIQDDAVSGVSSLDGNITHSKTREKNFKDAAAAMEKEAGQLDELAKRIEEQRQKAFGRKKEAEEKEGNFWTPTYQKNKAREVIEEETRIAEALERRREEMKNRAGSFRGKAEASTERAGGAASEAADFEKQREERERAFFAAQEEEERLRRERSGKEEVFSLRDAKGGNASARIAREAEEKREAEEEKRRKQTEREREKRQREIDRDARGIPGKVDGALRGAADTGLTRDVRAAAGALKDGATGGELGELGAALKELAEAAKSAPAKQKAELAALRAEVKALAQQIKNNR